MGSQVITTTGTSSWNWPAGVTSVIAEAIGGGGGGGTASGNPCTGGGGKGGGYAKKTITKGAESSLSISVGTGGAAASNGSPTTITQNAVVVLTATGGGGGSSMASSSNNGAGGTAENGTAIGDVTRAGGNGAAGTFASGTNGSGAGGGAASSGSAGGNASIHVGGTAGTGTFNNGGTYANSGANGVGDSTAGASPSASFYGGGASGGKANSNPDRVGGTGRQGVVVLTWTDPPAYAASQSSFRFYADGTESGSTPLEAQDTNATVDAATSDVNLQLRVRLQETGGGVGGASTDDYQLRHNWNSMTGYMPVQLPNETNMDSYLSDFVDSAVQVSGGLNQKVGQSIQVALSGRFLTRFDFWLKRVGTPTGNAYLKVYDFSGTHGSSAVPTGGELATSDPVDVSTIGDAGFGWIGFFFPLSLAYSPGAGAKVYVLEFTGGDASNYLEIGLDNSAPAAAGNFSYNNGSGWTATVDYDAAYRYWASQLSYVLPHSSANVTNGEATTNRLGAGSGSFVAGKVSEDAVVDDLNLTKGNYTELLYSLTLPAELLSDTDYLDFRVYRNGSALSNYEVTPRITVSVSGGVITKKFGLLGVG